MRPNASNWNEAGLTVVPVAGFSQSSFVFAVREAARDRLDGLPLEVDGRVASAAVGGQVGTEGSVVRIRLAPTTVRPSSCGTNRGTEERNGQRGCWPCSRTSCPRQDPPDLALSWRLNLSARGCSKARAASPSVTFVIEAQADRDRDTVHGWTSR